MFFLQAQCIQQNFLNTTVMSKWVRGAVFSYQWWLFERVFDWENIYSLFNILLQLYNSKPYSAVIPQENYFPFQNHYLWMLNWKEIKGYQVTIVKALHFPLFIIQQADSGFAALHFHTDKKDTVGILWLYYLMPLSRDKDSDESPSKGLNGLPKFWILILDRLKLLFL